MSFYTCLQAMIKLLPFPHIYSSEDTIDTGQSNGHFSKCPEELEHYCIHGECRYIKDQDAPSCRWGADFQTLFPSCVKCNLNKTHSAKSFSCGAETVTGDWQQGHLFKQTTGCKRKPCHLCSYTTVVPGFLPSMFKEVDEQMPCKKNAHKSKTKITLGTHFMFFAAGVRSVSLVPGVST